MGETAVLSNLSVDSSGVVSGIRQSNTALGSGEAALGKFGASQKGLAGTTDLIVGKMFSFRAAALALGRSLGIVGLVTALAFAVKALVTDLVSSTTWFKRSSEAIKDWWGEITKGDDALDKLARRLKTLGAEGGAVSGLAQLRQMAERQKEINRLMAEGPQALRAPGPLPAAGTLGIAGMVGAALMRGPVEKEPAAAAVALKVELVEVQRQINETIKKLTDLGISSEQIAEATGTAFKAVPPTVKEIEEAAKKAAAELEKSLDAALEFTQIVDIFEQKRLALFSLSGLLPPEQVEAAVGSVTAASALLNEQLGLGKISVDQYALGIDNLEKKLLSLGLTAQDVESILNKLHVAEPPELGPWESFVESLKEAATTVQLNIALAQTAISAFGNAIAGAAASGKLSFRQLAADMLLSLVPVLAGWGALNLVVGIFTRDAQLIAAGAIAIGAAFAAGAAARALGGGSGATQASASSGGGGGGGRGGGLAAGSNQSITVVVQGSVEDPNAFARKIAALINTNRADGARA